MEWFENLDIFKNIGTYYLFMPPFFSAKKELRETNEKLKEDVFTMKKDKDALKHENDKLHKEIEMLKREIEMLKKPKKNGARR